MATTVFTDGSTINNKRGSKKAIGGYGVYWGDHDERNRSEPFTIFPVTNNRCETYAIIVALELYISGFDKEKDKKLIIKTDSMLLVNTMTKWIHKWIRNNWKKSDGKPVVNMDLLKILYNLVNKNKDVFRVEFVHVKAAHDYNAPKDKSSIEWVNWNGNNNADLLAKAGGQQIFEKQIGITKLNIFEISKNL